MNVLWFLVLSVYIYTVSCTDETIRFCSHSKDMDQVERVRIYPKDRHDYDATVRSRRSTQQRSNFDQQFTLSIHYDDSVNTGLSLGLRQRLQDIVMPQVKQFFESILVVRPLSGPILLNRACTGNANHIIDGFTYCAEQCEAVTKCGTAEIPTDHLNRCRECNGNQASSASDCTESGTDGSGADASFVLYVSAVSVSPCPTPEKPSSTLAYAAACRIERDFDRPIAGYANFCPLVIDSASDESMITIAKHELLHALGFSSGLYSYWRDENGDPRSARDSNGNPIETSSSTLKQVTYTDWSTFNGNVEKNISLLTTPKLVMEGRRHFNCSTLEGVQLEDQGGEGTSGSHWEERILHDELMTGYIGNGNKISRFTFALLEDSGWYKVNYSYAEQFLWGRASGCDLSAGSCGGYMKSQRQKKKSISPFCDTEYLNSQYQCNIDRTAVSTCNLIYYDSSLPIEYQYFNYSNMGGKFFPTDYCPFQTPFIDTVCSDTSNNISGINNALAQTFGPRSRCVLLGQQWRADDGIQTIRVQPLFRAGCYNYNCSNGQVMIYILDEPYVCTTAGEELIVNQTSNGVTYTGSIICPSCLEICYDDFENCPEAAELYSEFVLPPDGSPVQAMPSCLILLTLTLVISVYLMV